MRVQCSVCSWHAVPADDKTSSNCGAICFIPTSIRLHALCLTTFTATYNVRTLIGSISSMLVEPSGHKLHAAVSQITGWHCNLTSYTAYKLESGQSLRRNLTENMLRLASRSPA